MALPRPAMKHEAILTKIDLLKDEVDMLDEVIEMISPAKIKDSEVVEGKMLNVSVSLSEFLDSHASDKISHLIGEVANIRTRLKAIVGCPESIREKCEE